MRNFPFAILIAQPQKRRKSIRRQHVMFPT